MDKNIIEPSCARTCFHGSAGKRRCVGELCFRRFLEKQVPPQNLAPP